MALIEGKDVCVARSKRLDDNHHCDAKWEHRHEGCQRGYTDKGREYSPPFFVRLAWGVELLSQAGDVDDDSSD
jgi:hypothetical protein